MSAGPAVKRVEVMGGEVLAVLVQVGAVGVERVAREAALQLQVGEEVEDEPLEAGLGARWIGDDHGGGVLPAAPQPLRRKAAPAARAAAKKSGSSSRLRPIVFAGRPVAA